MSTKKRKIRVGDIVKHNRSYHKPMWDIHIGKPTARVLSIHDGVARLKDTAFSKTDPYENGVCWSVNFLDLVSNAAYNIDRAALNVVFTHRGAKIAHINGELTHVYRET